MIYKKVLLKTAKLKGDREIILRFPFDVETLKLVRSLPGRTYNPKERNWSCPLSAQTIIILKNNGFRLQGALERYITNINAPKINVKGLKFKLRDYQKKGVEFFEMKEGRALNGDEMGLGKTIQTLAYLQHHPELKPVIIVCPASVKINWMRETLKWTTIKNIQIISGKTVEKIVGDFIIINYDVLFAWRAKLQKLDAKIIVFDECHKIKNNKAKRTKAAKLLAKHIPKVIGLSGTFIENRPIEGYNIIKIIDPTIVGSRWEYGERYCGLRYNGFGWDFNGHTNVEELHQLLTSTIMLRRLKSEVEKELPPKIRSVIPLELTNKGEYKLAERDFVTYLKLYKGKEPPNNIVLPKIEALKQLAVKGILNQTIEWINDFIESEGKLIVFAWHLEVINKLMEAFKGRAVKVDGSVTGTKRQQAIDIFQSDQNMPLFIGQMAAAGEGITLTAASNVAVVELPQKPSTLNQAIDRAHRIGQTKTVNIYFLIAINTIVERLAKLLDQKQTVIDNILNGKEPERESLISLLISQYF